MTPAREGLEPCPFCGVAGLVYKAFPMFPTPWHVAFDHEEDCPLRFWEGMTYKTEREAIGNWNRRVVKRPLTADPDKQSLTVGEADAREVLITATEPHDRYGALALRNGVDVSIKASHAIRAMLAFTSTIQDGARVRIARALYEHWVEEDFSEEYCGWDALLGKEIWLARADAAIRKLKEEG